ncbi:autoinducer binding domain-containing protein [Yersinia sp. Marseille-Q3913]|uniref:autoinducer binding domain-containing protein n=1 Tax=Yersinia sp. Marseille-Q3913 TaxID=2830769 RepID=UPI001BAFD6A4|nr:autoinducer binding domain-containing protein [Yersinia sp. Marseille-Q3913]MBS0053873.1 autoinducer binding domain-containing protein [Yersinia sp. Marseille-Q3913]
MLISKYNPESFNRIDVSEETLQQISNYITLNTGFSFFSFVIREIYPITESRIYTFDNYNDSWRTLYEKNKLWKIDPVIFYKPMPQVEYAVWDSLFFKGHEEIWAYGVEYGYQSGITFGMPLPQGYHSILSLSNMSHSITPKEISLAQSYFSKICVKIINSIILNAESPITFNKSNITLTKRELMILMFSVDGMTSHEIAAKIFISKSTVDFHMLNIIKKLNCKNKFQAISKALIMGLI